MEMMAMMMEMLSSSLTTPLNDVDATTFFVVGFRLRSLCVLYV